MFFEVGDLRVKKNFVYKLNNYLKSIENLN